MVKLLNTPFGNYGYVLNRNPELDAPLSIVTSREVMIRHPRKVRTSTYDAKFLRTTDLSVGSQLVKLSDPQSYMKRGLLHKGQDPIGPLDGYLQGRRSTNSSKELQRSKSEERSQQSNRARTESGSHLFPRVHQKWQDRVKQDSVQHAGKSTMGKQQAGFACRYATSRSDLGSLAMTLGSGCEGSSDMVDDEDEDENKPSRQETKKSPRQLLLLDPKDMTFSKLGRLKSQRLYNIYSEMFGKFDQNRRTLIKKRVETAEKIKETLHSSEVEKQRQLLKSSMESQRNQLQELRSRHSQKYVKRLNLLYDCKQLSDEIDKGENAQHEAVKPGFSQLASPRSIYGLPDEGVDTRPLTVPGKRIYRFPPGKLSVDSYKRTRNNLAVRFTNVWNKTSPRQTAKVTTSDLAM